MPHTLDTTYTDEQIKVAKAALHFWDALPCNPIAVAGVLHDAIKAEFALTGTMDMVDKPSPVHVVNWALQYILTGTQVYADTYLLLESVKECRNRIDSHDRATKGEL